MATACHLVPRTADNGPTLSPNLQLNGYPQTLSFNDLDNNRYQPLTSQLLTHQTNRPESPTLFAYPLSTSPRNPNQQDPNQMPYDSQSRSALPLSWTNGTYKEDQSPLDSYTNNELNQQISFQRSDYVQQQHPLPPGAAPSIIDRYGVEDPFHRSPSTASRPARQSSLPQDNRPNITSQLDQAPPHATSGRTPTTDPKLVSPSSPTARNLPVPGQSFQGPDSSTTSSSPALSPVMPLPTSPSYSTPMAIPISPKPRAYAQQPTYITPPTAPNPLNPIFSPAPADPPEEVCMECAMRDQDMADVDVSSPGVWERDSDVLYEDLLRREREDKLAGVTSSDPSRPRGTGGRLTETNLKIWLSVNPREPTSRMQTLEKYIKSQRRLLEAEAIAHVRAMQEARQLDNRMRDAYSQLRRSAYDSGNSASPIDDLGGVRIKPVTSSSRKHHTRSHSRDVTLLENGMIVEHVDVRKEEREARERRRKEERRARKSSRSSAVDVTSLYSSQSVTAYAESGLGVKPPSRYSSSSPRPSSILTNTWERPHIPRAYSQASFSEVQSLGSGSPRRTRFFGMKNLSTGWRSQDSFAPSGVSGSMVDMHVALQREAVHTRHLGQNRVDVENMLARQSQAWPSRADGILRLDTPPEDKPRKKPGGLKKIWRIVTGSSKSSPNTPHYHSSPLPHDRNEDDTPLAPPPPLSYLVDRGPGDLNARHAPSTPSLLTSPTSAKNGGLSSPGMSPPTAPSSNLPSPASSGRSGDRDVIIEGRKVGSGVGTYENQEETVDNAKADDTEKTPVLGTVYPTMHDPTTRQRVLSSPSLLSNQSGTALKSFPPMPSRPASMATREKSLPPIPDDVKGGGRGERYINGQSNNERPRTVYTYDPRQMPQTAGPPQNVLQLQAGFRASEGQRQSFAPPASLPLGAVDPGRGVMSRYDEFGLSGGSLGRVDGTRHQIIPAANTKRKSRFAVVSLFGKKQSSNDYVEDSATSSSQHLGSGQFSESMTLVPDDNNNVGFGGGGGTSRQSTMAPRMSVMSRRALEELVEQDPQFVAYRYPSHDQRLDLLG